MNSLIQHPLCYYRKTCERKIVFTEASQNTKEYLRINLNVQDPHKENHRILSQDLKDENKRKDAADGENNYS